MKKKLLSVLLAGAAVCAALVTGCSNGAAKTAVNTETAAAAETENEMDEDRKAADEVAAMIDAIYVQRRTENTDQQCADAKAAWDALTDKQKSLVDGKNADFDYFGRDTGDASKDDPRNQDNIGENEILAVSFGTSFNDSRAIDIKGIEDALQKAYPDWSVRRAFTSQIIINHVQARDGQFIDNMDQALERAAANGVKNLIVQPTHLMHGAEYEELVASVEAYSDHFESVKIAEPLLGEVGTDFKVINEDKERVARSLTEEAVKDAGYESLEAAKEDEAAFVFLGHGTSHTAKVSYIQMQTQMDELGYDNVFVGTVEGNPEETSCEAIIEAAAEAGYKKVILRPLMVVAGDHANNDMAGKDEDSWLSMFQASGKFESAEAQIFGLGGIEAIQQIYADHTAEAMKSAGISKSVSETEELPDGIYTAEFHTDSGMFHVNEACEGRGTLTVKDGKMNIHISLVSKNIVNLYAGSAEDAQKDGAEILMPTEDQVTYSDGFTETVYGFDVPVPFLDQEFDLALIGKKGVWYDHKVSVSDAEPAAEAALESAAAGEKEASASLEDGRYLIDLSMEGGSGKAFVISPAKLVVLNGKMTAILEWNSPNYDYMIAGEEKFLPINVEGNSVFEIPVNNLQESLPVIGDTVAMSTPHEIEYTITFDFGSIRPED